MVGIKSMTFCFGSDVCELIHDCLTDVSDAFLLCGYVSSYLCGMNPEYCRAEALKQVGDSIVLSL